MPTCQKVKSAQRRRWQSELISRCGRRQRKEEAAIKTLAVSVIQSTAFDCFRHRSCLANRTLIKSKLGYHIMLDEGWHLETFAVTNLHIDLRALLRCAKTAVFARSVLSELGRDSGWRQAAVQHCNCQQHSLARSLTPLLHWLEARR